MNITTLNHEDLTMSSLDFLNQVINPAREAAGESKVENGKFIRKVVDELDDLPAPTIIRRYGNEVKTYNLNHEQMMLVGMRESKAVRKSVLATLKELQQKHSPMVQLPDFTNPAIAARASYLWMVQVR